ncbi:MAG: DUF3305 domain-containing protein [Rhizobiales bacterium]|nr:DUF3305 domain-containing protein [Hyphomicrobiales bacterium]
MAEEILPVGVIVDKKKSASPWIDHLWVPSAVVTGLPDAAPMTLVAKSGADESYFAGAANLVFASGDTGQYLENLVTGTPLIWIAVRAEEHDSYVTVVSVTADPSEGESLTDSGSNIVQPVPMPPDIAARLAAFVDQHHVEREFFKRKRDRTDPEALGYRRPNRRDGS